MRGTVLALVMMAGCGSRPDPAPSVATNPAPPTPEAPVVVKGQPRVELTAVTLADDCGGTAPQGPPAPASRASQADPGGSIEVPHAAPATKPAASQAYPGDFPKGDTSRPTARARRERRCEQTSMQLAITAMDPAVVQVKSVELFDDKGASLGMLAASKPTAWSESTSTYVEWDERVPAATTSMVSYVLQAPSWDKIPDRWDRTFTVKTVLTVGGTDLTAEREVTIIAEASLPPEVRT